MKNARSMIRIGLLLTVLTLGGAAGHATAQTEAQPAAAPPPKPPRAAKADDPNLLTNVFGLLVIGGAVLGASLIPSRRGHQD